MQINNAVACAMRIVFAVYGEKLRCHKNKEQETAPYFFMLFAHCIVKYL